MPALLRLPSEVLSNIFDWLRLIEDKRRSGSPTKRSRRPRTWAPICRALRPYTQAYRFHKVAVTSSAQLARLAATTASAPDLGRAVRAVVLLGRKCAKASAFPRGHTAAMAKFWLSVCRCRSITIAELDAAFDGLLLAAADGLELSALESIEVSVPFVWWNNPYDPVKWEKLLRAAPNLKKLIVTNTSSPRRSDKYPVPPLARSAAFQSAVVFLSLAGIAAPHDRAAVDFANKFPRLDELGLQSETGKRRPDLLGPLHPPGLRRLSYEWHAYRPSVPKLERVDLRRLEDLVAFTFQCRQCAPTLELDIPPKLRRLAFQPINNVPLAALCHLIMPDSSRHHPVLKHIEINLPIGDGRLGTELAGMLVDDMRALRPEARDEMRWAAAVSEQGLRDLIEQARSHGVKLTGNCTAVFKFNQVVASSAEDVSEGIPEEEEEETLSDLYRHVYWDAQRTADLLGGESEKARDC